MEEGVYSKELEKITERIRVVYRSESGLRNGEKYIRGLLSPAERKNGWQMSEEIGEKTPYKMQQFLYRGSWNADELRDVTREYIGEEEGTLVVDETGFMKQGKKSCGVKRQYSGTAGRIENCQIGVFLTYAGRKGNAIVDRRLYIPEEWTKDSVRCKEAGVPEKVKFQTKPNMALEMLQEAYNAGFPFAWVTGDCIYGDFRDIAIPLEII
jgi:SRSO17 transposase